MSGANTDIAPSTGGEWWRRLARLYPRSLFGRVWCMLVAALLLAELLAGALWYYQYRSRIDAGLESAIRSMTQGVIATVNFMSALPRNYRQLVLAQQRELGGSQFFVSINNHELKQQPLPASKAGRKIVEIATRELALHLRSDQPVSVALTRADQLRVFNAGVLMADLPPGWARFSLPILRQNAPILVLQLQINPKEWLFLAAPLPPPYDALDVPFLTPRQFWFTAFGMLLVLLFTWPLLRRELKPIEALASAAEELDSRLDVPPLPEAGNAEFVAATRAFNRMQGRLRAYLHNREMLFTAISHDLKTPITRLRLRAEMLDDETQQQKFEADLKDLELMVKGALQSMKDTDIHENIERVDVMQLLAQLIEAYGERVLLRGKVAPIRGRPLAIRRCIGNLIDNGLKFGRHVTLTLDEQADRITLFVGDDGPGLPDRLLEKVFEPYFRGHHDQGGTGLGLAIARSIARSHGGELVLHNDPQGGLMATLVLLRNG
ncbi:ATP-binding protein [Jeongeupia sp. USM3]|uniref:ATP-binding protein n=1 Tax=Jeongeupia sp. USM3 TaxID=1906741 RepID=UPI00089DF34B|nr:ATP-binding protein [Jeongeupia sp. USM3]AOX99409.1 two-component sensor histidine kinase [Jeongeupia sp. USM3]